MFLGFKLIKKFPEPHHLLLTAQAPSVPLQDSPWRFPRDPCGFRYRSFIFYIVLESMSAFDNEKVKAEPKVSQKKIFHLGVLTGLVLLVFLLDQLLFGSFTWDILSKQQLGLGPSVDILVGILLAFGALQSYLWQGKASEGRPKGKTSSSVPRWWFQFFVIFIPIRF